MAKKNYWLIYSDFDLTSVIDTVARDNYYIVSDDQLQFLSEAKYPFYIICEVDFNDPSLRKYFSKELEVNKYYPDSFSILKFDRLKLEKQTKDLYFFRYKDYCLIINKKFYEI